MKLHYQTVSPELVSSLKQLMQLPSLKDFILVGGTNLALQRGHRQSIDIDLFSDQSIDTINLCAIEQELKEAFNVCIGTDALSTPEIGYHLYIGNSEEELIKLDLWFVDAFVFPIHTVDGIRMADLREIAAFKLLAATQQNRRQKDFWDIHELMDIFSLKQMIEFAEKRYPYNFDSSTLLQSLKTADSIELAPEGIVCLRGNYWELIVWDLAREASNI